MGLFDFIFDSDLKQRHDLQRLESAASDSVEMSSTLAADTTALRRRVDRAELVVEAMFRLMQEKGVATADELKIFIARVDLEDGVEDGKISATPEANPRKCPSCARPANFRRRTECVYCGAALKPAAPSGAPYR